MKRLAIIVLIVLSIMVAFSSYFYYRWNQFNNFSPLSGSWPNVGSFSDSEQIRPPLLPEMGQITNGKIFTSKDKEFQFRYPQEWILTPQTPKTRVSQQEVVEIWQLTSYQPSAIKRANYPPASVRIELEILNNLSRSSLEELFPCEGLEIIECRPVKINGLVYRRVIKRLPSGAQAITIAILRNGKIYKMTGYPTPGEGEEKAVATIHSIFNTFRFVSS